MRKTRRKILQPYTRRIVVNGISVRMAMYIGKYKEEKIFKKNLAALLILFSAILIFNCAAMHAREIDNAAMKTRRKTQN